MTKLDDPVDLFLGIGWVESSAVVDDSRVIVSWSTPDGYRLHLAAPGSGPVPANEIDSLYQGMPVVRGGLAAFWAQLASEMGLFALFVTDLEAGSTRRLPVSSTLGPAQIAWLDERHVVTTERDGARASLVAVDVAGRSPKRSLYDLDPTSRWLDPAPSIGTDGRVGMLVRTKMSQDVLLLDPSDNTVRTLVEGNRSAAPCGIQWFSDGTRMLLTIRRRRTVDVRIVDLEAGTMEVLPVPAPVGTPAVDPAGRRIALAVSEWPWTRPYVFDLVTRELNAISIPPGTCADTPLWNGERLLLRVFGPDLPPGLCSWSDGDSEVSPLVRSAKVPQRTTPRVYRLPTEEGFDLPALVHEPMAGAAKATVVMLHGGPAACWRVSWNPVLLSLTGAGYRVVLIETRGTTFNAWPIPPLPVAEHGVKETADIRACIGGLRDLGLAEPGRIVLAGHSHGAYLAYRASLESEDVVAVVMTSGYLHPAALVDSADPEVHRFSALAYAGGERATEAERLPSRCPVLAVHGEHDRQVPASVAARMHAALSGQGHAWLLLADEEHSYRRRSSAARYVARMLEFLDATVGAA
jgi:dipeptidyl aminopeptidase/acylaminoacyl peptidase